MDYRVAQPDSNGFFGRTKVEIVAGRCLVMGRIPYHFLKLENQFPRSLQLLPY